MASRFFVFDTETTDLIANSVLPLTQQPEIIEFFGHIVTRKGEVIRELEFKCKPTKPLSEEITKITGITNDDLKNELPFAHYEGLVRGIIGDSDCVVAHNLAYDWNMVMYELMRCETEKKINWPKGRICTVEQTEYFKGHRLNLSSLHEYLFGSPFSGAHRARVDVEALTRCFVELCNRGEI